ncbi:c-type cytochrome [Sphingomonas suaedae]|uniref:C-type cytochrome n=1 Tax=Sphingomonas suaedae TaxID=2599297 RepID=A0A518RFB5_9SPHN|nr:c-type cytochrome [Sphingomonas suaedae]
MDWRALWVLTGIALAGCGTVERGSADRFTASGELLAVSGGDAGAPNACITCHGIDGRGNGAGTPRLAGLDRGYMAAQLEAYASGRRRHPEMESIARALTPAQRVAVSAHYAALPYDPAPRMTGGTTAAQTLYHRGDPARGLAACASCHGDRGDGVGAANPPLSGQPSAYLGHQLAQWRQGARRNDPEGAMQRISRALSPAESVALAAYASSLPGDPPRPESRAASREARRADPRNDASAPPRRAAGSPPARR